MKNYCVAAKFTQRKTNELNYAMKEGIKERILMKEGRNMGKKITGGRNNEKKERKKTYK